MFNKKQTSGYKNFKTKNKFVFFPHNLQNIPKYAKYFKTFSYELRIERDVYIFYSNKTALTQ